jgi:hypothetical protein
MASNEMVVEIASIMRILCCPHGITHTDRVRSLNVEEVFVVERTDVQASMRQVAPLFELASSSRYKSH